MIARPLSRRFAAAASFALASVAPAFAQDSAAADADAASRGRIEQLTGEERAALLDRHEAFLALPAAERDRLRALHGTLAADGPTGALNRTLDRLRDVLERLTPSERAAVESARNPSERVVLLRRVIDGYRSIPPPPERTGDRSDLAPGQRSPLDWPRVDLIEEELVALLADRTSLLRLNDEDPLTLERPDRLLRILEAAATSRGSLRPRSPEDWLPDDLLTELDARLVEREFPGLSTWLASEGEPREIATRIARGQLVDILADALRDAWTERIGGSDGERLLDHLVQLPDREAARPAGRGARQDLAERVVRSDDVSAEDLGLTEAVRRDAVRALDLSNRLREVASGARRFGRRGGDRRGPDRHPSDRPGPRPEPGPNPQRPGFRPDR